MKKKIIIPILILLVLLIAIGIYVIFFMEYPDDKNTLYSAKFENTKLRFERYDYAVGQNQVVGVEKSTNRGRSYEKLTKEPITVSMEPKFVFINKKLGFAIAKPNLTKNNNYIGVKVTHDGGKTFVDVKINYDNPDIEILTVEDVPYLENDILKLPCSIYQVKEDKSGYEDKKLTFVSIDNGLTWNLEQTDEERYAQIKSDIDKEMERYYYIRYPKCNPNMAHQRVTHEELVYNAGFDKEKLLDTDYKSYCMVYIDVECVSEGKLSWNTYLSCKNHTDDGFKKWAEPFSSKKGN